MKLPATISLILLQTLFVSECFSQLSAEAGNDTIVCADSPSTLTIGGNPTATGGVPPYEYAWSGTYESNGRVYSASFMLEDTTVAKPVFKKGAIPDSVLLFVTVSDQEDGMAIDSILVRQSRYFICLGECRHDIAEGDSLIIEPCCLEGGIPPLKYEWSPSASLSDSTIKNPWAKPSKSTTYRVTITDKAGCQASTSTSVAVIPASLDEFNNQPEISIYPNPTSGLLKIEVVSERANEKFLKLIDMSGIAVKEIPISSSKHSLDISDISPGIYIYQWSSTDEILVSGKIIIK